MEMYTQKCMESQVCNYCTDRLNSVSQVLSEDVRLNIYFCVEVLNTLQNKYIAKYNVRYPKDLFVFQFKFSFCTCSILRLLSHYAQNNAAVMTSVCAPTQIQKYLKQKCFFCFSSNSLSSRFVVKTDLIRQKSFNFLKKCFKNKQKILIFQV